MLHELCCAVCCVCVFWLNVFVPFVCGVLCDVALFACLCVCVCLCVCSFNVRLGILCVSVLRDVVWHVLCVLCCVCALFM